MTGAPMVVGLGVILGGLVLSRRARAAALEAEAESPDSVVPELELAGAGESEYPGAGGFTLAKHFRDRGGIAVDKIVIHITDGQRDYRGTVHYFEAPERVASAHFVVGQEGEVWQCVRLAYSAQHAGKANRSSIGIEHSARSPGEHGQGDPGIPVTDAQYRASARLVVWCARQYGIQLDREHVLGHVEADPTTSHTDCPIGCWNWDYYWPLVLAEAGI